MNFHFFQYSELEYRLAASENLVDYYKKQLENKNQSTMEKPIILVKRNYKKEQLYSDEKTIMKQSKLLKEDKIEVCFKLLFL